MILFPYMKKVCINFSKMFNFNKYKGCKRCNNIRFYCGIIGIRQIEKEKNENINNYNSNNNNKNELQDCNNDNVMINIETFSKLLSDYNGEIASNGSNFDFYKIKEHLCAINNSIAIKNKEMKIIEKNKKLIDDMEIIDYQLFRGMLGGLFGHRIGYTHKNWDGITRSSFQDLSNDKLGFNNGDFVVLEYNKDNNSLLVEAHSYKSKNENQSQSETSNMNNCVTLTDTTMFRQNTAITGQDNKLILKNGYDYVIACCIRGCDKRSPGMNNVYTF